MPNNNDPPSTGRNNAPAAATNGFDDSFPTAANNANGLPEGNTNANTNQPTRAQTRAISRFQAAAERRNHRERSINKVVEHDHLSREEAERMYDKEVNIAMYGHTDGPANFVDDDRLPPPAPINPGPCLAAYRENFNATNIRKSSKAEKTFTNHQNNHTRFILWLYENNRQYITDELAHSLDDIIIDYSPIISRHSRYRRNGGKKSLEER